MASGISVKEENSLRIDCVLTFPSVRSWYLSRAEGDSRKSAIYRFTSYLKWRLKNRYPINPDDWIAECLNGNNRTLVSHLKILKEWAESDALDGCGETTRAKYYRNVRSFYAHHLVPLPPSRLATRRSRNAAAVPIKVSAVTFLEMAGKVLNYSDVSVRNRSIMLTMVQSGMDASTLTRVFNYVGFPQIAEHYGTEDWRMWDENRVPVRIRLIRPKTDYLHYTFVDRDAIVCLKQWLNVRASKFGAVGIRPRGNPSLIPISDPVYLLDSGKPLPSWYVTVIFKRTGVDAGVNVVPDMKVAKYKGASIRYPWHSHEVRDTLVTLARKVGADVTVANFFIGHNIDRYGYDKSPDDCPEYFREQYKKMASYLNVISGKETLLKEDYERKLVQELRKRDEEINDLRRRINQLGSKIMDKASK